MNKEDLKIGMFVRTKNNSYIPSEIAQIIKMDDKYIYLDIDKDSNVVWEYPEYIEKASFNIIDLIKVGDYVNGYPVNSISSVGKKIYEIEIKKTNNRKGVLIEKIRNNEDIKSIVTHEQMEQISYRLGE